MVETISRKMDEPPIDLVSSGKTSPFDSKIFHSGLHPRRIYRKGFYSYGVK